MKSLTQGEIAAVLGNLEVFSNLKPRELKTITGFCSIQEVPKEEVVFRPLDLGDCLYVVVSGSVIMKGVSPEGDMRVEAQLIPGECFGELEFFSTGTRNAYAQAGEETVVLRFPGLGLIWDNFLHDHPKIAGNILKKFLTSAARRIRRANELVKENSQLIQDLRRQVYGDKMTGLLNRTWLEENFPGMLKDPLSPVTLLLMKPDNFKYINDTFGHEAGDAALVEMAGALGRFIGDRGTAFRYMGNELGVVLPRLGESEAIELSKTLLKSLNDLSLAAIPGLGDTRLSVSIGAGIWPKHSSDAVQLISAVHELPLIGRSKGGNLVLSPEGIV